MTRTNKHKPAKLKATRSIKEIGPFVPVSAVTFDWRNGRAVVILRVDGRDYVAIDSAIVPITVRADDAAFWRLVE
jgi:hypothetical protein